MKERGGVLATRRFGLGARIGDVDRVAKEPIDYVLSQLKDATAGRLSGTGLAPSHETLAMVMEARRQQREMRRETQGETQPQQRQAPASPVTQSANSQSAEGGKPASSDVERQMRPARIMRDVLLGEADARIRQAINTDAPFVERLVMFWSNHFAVAVRKGNVRALAGAYEREAIRPHVLGRFSEMLRAVVQHPAMLIYLDNQASIGPNSRAGARRGRGLNENLAREILELHTLGVDGGYSQTDVTALARLLTGWTIGGPGNQRDAEPGRFWFAANRHEPGPHTVLGHRYPAGQAGGEKAIDDLARHPKTARHLAHKFAAHFVTSPPPPELVERLTRRFRESDGDLGALARELAEAPAAWQVPQRKVLPPYDFLISMARGFSVPAPTPQILRLSAALGQPLWDPPSPKGWPDDDDAWLAPAAIRERLRIAEQAAARVAPGRDPRVLARDLLGRGLSPASAEAIARAESGRQGFELLILSPELQRR